MLHFYALALLLLPPGAPENRGGKAGGELRVTAVVTSSVSIAFAADGTQTIIVANAPADEAALVAAATQARPVLPYKDVQRGIKIVTHKCRGKVFVRPK